MTPATMQPAQSLPVTGISSMATRHILTELSALYAEQTGKNIAFRAMGGVDAAKIVRQGEAFDIIALVANVVDKLEHEGFARPGSRRDFTRSGIAIAVPAGAPKPDLGSEAAVRAAMLAARHVAYSTGPSGDHLKALWEKWGISAEMNARALQAPAGVPVATLVAEGKADFGLQQLSELLGQPGIDIAGPLPPAIQAVSVFALAIASASNQPEEAGKAIAFLTSPTAAPIIRKYGMEPA